MPRLFYSVFLVFAACLAGCGLGERERAVTETNEAIQVVQQAIVEVAELINELPDRSLERADLEPLRESLVRYQGHAEALNASVRTLGTHFDALQTYLRDTFRPAAEDAATRCQQALDVLNNEASTDDDYTRALTSIGLCLDRYATAVSNVSAEYSRLAR